ncbi:hypothetical protein FQR65_LT20468 [Abscondita terminalis]|nr:hypothetical protein FQR65_LT20468 [Abscondita terminalis]
MGPRNDLIVRIASQAIAKSSTTPFWFASAETGGHPESEAPAGVYWRLGDEAETLLSLTLPIAEVNCTGHHGGSEAPFCSTVANRRNESGQTTAEIIGVVGRKPGHRPLEMSEADVHYDDFRVMRSMQDQPWPGRGAWLSVVLHGNCGTGEIRAKLEIAAEAINLRSRTITFARRKVLKSDWIVLMPLAVRSSD